MSAPDAGTGGAPDAWGLHADWVDVQGEQHRVPDHVLGALREATGRAPDDLGARTPVVTRPGRPLPPDIAGLGPLDVACEDGERRSIDAAVPGDFPLGYHRLRTPAAERLLVVSPGRCAQPGGRAWGWAVQVYALRSRGSWGVGDLADLRAVREWSARLGAGFLLVNPLHAVAPTLPQEPSPYLPASRRFLNPVYLRVEEVPGAGSVDLPGYAARAAALPTEDVDRDAVWVLKREALREIYDEVGSVDVDAARWREQQGRPLREFATWCALAERHGPDWRDWPDDLRRPDTEAVAAFCGAQPTEVGFHAWLQWALDRQLRAATAGMTVLQDLPIGVGGGGADAWAWQDVLAAGVRVGAPPDVFNTTGQDWGSPPLVPWRLQEAAYAPFVESVRATMTASGGIRVDHVMGLFRLWWVPEGGSPAEGAYVRYPSDDLLDIVALESHRAGAVVVGEDLGTVEPGVRERLAEHGVLSYKVLWFEGGDPAGWPVSSMAAVTTHDLATVAGLWSGEDAAEQVALGLGGAAEVEAGQRAIVSRLADPAGLDSDARLDDVVLAAHRLLGRAPSMLLSATLEDAVGQRRRPNVPGTTARSNWRLPLSTSVEELVGHPGAAALARVLADALS